MVQNGNCSRVRFLTWHPVSLLNSPSVSVTCLWALPTTSSGFWEQRHCRRWCRRHVHKQRKQHDVLLHPSHSVTSWLPRLATLRIVAERGYNVSKSDKNVTKRELEILILDMLKIRWQIPTTYHNMATTWYDVAQRGYNVAKTWQNVNRTHVLRCSVFLLRCGTIRYDKLWYATIRCGTLRYVVVRYDTLWYATIRCGTLRYVVVRYAARRQRNMTRHNVAQHGDSDAIAYVAAARHNVAQQGDSVTSTWRQRGTLPKFAFFSSERGDQKRGTTARPKRETTKGQQGTMRIQWNKKTFS